jgi:UPF0755 protein
VVFRLVVLAGVFALLLVAGSLVMRALSQRGGPLSTVDLSPNLALNPIEAAALSVYLAASQEELSAPAGDDLATRLFQVQPGQNASQVAASLEESGLISDATLFTRYLRFYGLDVQLEAGTYELASTMTIPQIAYALTDAAPPEITVRVTEGWRREQIADWIDLQPDIPFTGAEFLAVTGAGALLPSGLKVSAQIPPGVTLEGFLFPDTYRLPVDAVPGDLVDRMLANLDAKLTDDLRSEVTAGPLTLYQVVTLASIVEREAVLAEERPQIASVYLNRLQIGMLLEADPTVQYAMGYQIDTGQWWNLNLTQADYHAVDSPYNTYLYPGLPPGPIASPGIDSIRAVVYPAQTPYLFFRKTCDNSGAHNFSTTYEEHLGYACP